MNEFQIEANAVIDGGIASVRLEIADGVIQDIQKVECVSNPGLILFPGFIDVHVHARDYSLPGDSSPEYKSAWERMTAKESFITAGQAAVNGGVTLYAAMPNDPVPPDNPVTYSLKKQASESSPCPVLIFSCITASSSPWADIPYKLYLDHKESASSFSYWRDVEDALSRYSNHHVFFHAEDPVILQENSHFHERWRSRPPDAEISAVRKILELTGKYSLRTHICHVSTTQAVKLVHEYNTNSSQKVTCEVTPHHLFFSVDDSGVFADGAVVQFNRSFFDCNPPLRSESERLGMLEMLADGFIDMIAGDHAPHTNQDKLGGAPGMPHLDTYGAFAAWLINRQRISPEKIADLFSRAPASLMKNYLHKGYGDLKIGNPANITGLDLNGRTVVMGSMIRDRGPLRTKCGWSPFDGIELPGLVSLVLIRGQLMCSIENGFTTTPI